MKEGIVIHKKALKRHRRALASKAKAKSRRKGGNKRQRQVARSEISRYKEKIKFPFDFSIEGNRDGVLSRISKIEDCLNKRRSTVVLLDDVKKIDIEAIVLLLGIMAEFNTHRIEFNGTFPKDPIMRGRLVHSGFLKQLYPNNFLYTFGSHKGIFTHGSNILDQELTAKIIVESLESVFGSKKRSQGVQRILIEAMKNTIQHADLAENKRHWWLSVREQPDKNKATFSFLDYGIGIFHSLRSRDSTDPGYSWFEKYVNLGTANGRILKKIMDGELHSVSRTRKSQHGTGLPGMKTALDNNYVSRLVIMSNDVYGDVGRDSYETLRTDFSGTFIQFEVIKSCKSFDI